MYAHKEGKNIHFFQALEEGIERQVKVLDKNLAIFFLCPSKQFLPILISFQIQLLEYFL